MDVYPKFIIESYEGEGDCLIIAKCSYHKQLVENIANVKGGGWWSIDNEEKVFILFGKSFDFGRAKIEDIANCIKNKKVFSSKYLTRNYTDNFKFRYKNEVGELIDLETYQP